MAEKKPQTAAQVEARRKLVERNRQKAAERREQPPETAPQELHLPEPKTMRAQIGFTLNTYNSLLLFIPGLQREALNMLEADMLAEGLDDAQKVSAKARKYIKYAMAAGGWGSLGVAVCAIVMARMGRHGMIPGVDPAAVQELTPEQQLQGIMQRRELEAARLAAEEADAQMDARREALRAQAAPQPAGQVPYAMHAQVPPVYAGQNGVGAA